MRHEFRDDQHGVVGAEPLGQLDEYRRVVGTLLGLGGGAAGSEGAHLLDLGWVHLLKGGRGVDYVATDARSGPTLLHNSRFARPLTRQLAQPPK